MHTHKTLLMTKILWNAMAINKFDETQKLCYTKYEKIYNCGGCRVENSRNAVLLYYNVEITSLYIN